MKWQVTKRCSRVSSNLPQKVHNEESILPIFFKNVFVTRYLFTRLPIYRVRISSWISNWIFELGFSSWIFELDFRVGQCKLQTADQG